MQITSNTVTELNTVEVEFNIGADDFETSVQSAFLKVRKNIAVPGFRKGKATRKMIESNYGEGVFYEEAVNELYREWVPKVIDELSLEIVDAPEVEVLDLSKEAGVTFKSKFTVKPEVEIDNYMGIEVEIAPQEVTDERLEKELEKLRADNARIIDSSETPVEEGDLLKFDFTGYCAGVPFDGGTATDFHLEVGSGKFIPGFEEQIIGRKVGEDFDVNVTFPDDYPSETIRGKEALFKCKINEKSSKELAELDDEFVKDISEFDTLEELKEDVRGKIAEDNEKIRSVELEREVAEKVTAMMKAEIPPVMFDDRIDEIAREWAYKYNMRSEDFARHSGMTLEQYREGFREVAEKQVKFRLALEKIAKIEGCEASDEEIEAEYDKMAKENRMTAEKVRSIVTRAGIASDIKAEKALEMLKASAKITYKIKQDDKQNEEE
jgi:trigger factor